MKFVLSLFIILIVAKIGTIPDGDYGPWNATWNYFKTAFWSLELHPDTGLNINQFVDKYNYTLEVHEVITEDGYILTLHRIPHRKPNSIVGPGTGNNITRPVALLVHCLACSSAVWLWQGPNASLAFQLVDLGYDVWLSNARGNSYSDKHVVLTTKQPQFWNFSFHEIGYYDMPSNIDYILNVTKADKITYIGHSQGSTAGAILLSSKPEYNDKLNLMVIFSPVVYLNHLRSPIVRIIEQNDNLIKQTLEFLGIYSIQRSQYLGLATDTFCNSHTPVQGLCILTIGLFGGFDAEQIDKSKLTVFLTFTPSGISYKDVDHYAQLIASGEFRQFDYGNPEKNYQYYGSAVPPSYDITRIRTPVAVYYGKNDFLVAVQDAERFISELKTEIVDQYLIDYDKFNHLDFIMAKDVKIILYDRAVEVIQKYNPLLPGN